jgi:hypothetical protein
MWTEGESEEENAASPFTLELLERHPSGKAACKKDFNF